MDGVLMGSDDPLSVAKSDAYSLQYCRDTGSWCCAAGTEDNTNCCHASFHLFAGLTEHLGHRHHLDQRTNAGSPFGTLTIPAATEPDASPILSTTPTAHTIETLSTLAASSLISSPLISSPLQSDAKSSTSAPTSTSPDAASPSPGSDTRRQALIAVLAVVSAVAAVCLLALVAALVYIRRLSCQTRDPAISPGPGASAIPDQGVPRPDSAGDPYETVALHHATPAMQADIMSNAFPLAHELSPIREQSESSQLSGGGGSGATASTSSAGIFDDFGEDMDWAGFIGSIIIAERPEDAPR